MQVICQSKALCHCLTNIFQIQGSTQFFFSKNQLPALHQYIRPITKPSADDDDDDDRIVVNITAYVTETSTGENDSENTIFTIFVSNLFYWFHKSLSPVIIQDLK